MSEEEYEGSEGYAATQGHRENEEFKQTKMKTIQNIQRSQSVFVEASLNGAEFVGRSAFRVKDYVGGKDGTHLKHHSLKTGHSW